MKNEVSFSQVSDIRIDSIFGPNGPKLNSKFPHVTPYRDDI